MPRGFGAVRQAAAELESKRGSGGPGVFYFKLDAGEEAVVRFLEQDDDVFCAMMHEVPVENRSWGKNVVCIDQERDGTPCPGCERDMDRRFKGFINVIWFNAPVFRRDADRKLIRDSATNKPEKIGERPQVAVWNSGIRLFEELEEINANYKGLKSRRFKVKRKGRGLDTKYVIVPEDIDSGPQPMTEEEQKLAAEKPDLNQFTRPGTYEDFLRELSGGGQSQQSQESGSAPSRANPFMRNR
jgi:hypothetical protein